MSDRALTHDGRRRAVSAGLQFEQPEVTTDPRTRRTSSELTIHPAVGLAFEAFERSGIRWCLLRGESDLAAPDDVDLLVARRDLPRVGAVLGPLGYVPLRAWGRRPHRFFVMHDQASARPIKLDVVTELAYGRYQELRTGAAAGCLARRRHHGKLALLSPRDTFWTLLLHCALDREEFAAGDRARLLELAGEMDCAGELARIVDAAFVEPWNASTVLELVRAEEWATLTTIARDTRVARTSRPGTRLRILVKRAARRAANVLRPRSR